VKRGIRLLRDGMLINLKIQRNYTMLLFEASMVLLYLCFYPEIIRP
jgi:hypothetical protein